jgi:hypothetical protein
MASPKYPRPCIRFFDLPTGERNFLFETPGGCTTPFKTEFEAREYVIDRKMHRKYGRVYVQTTPLKFETMIADDGGDENELPDNNDD